MSRWQQGLFANSGKFVNSQEHDSGNTSLNIWKDLDFANHLCMFGSFETKVTGKPQQT